MHKKIAVAALLCGCRLLPAQIPDFTPPTPLFRAVMGNDAAAATQLLDGGTDPNQGRFIGSSPLLIAITNNNRPIVDALLAHGGDPKATDRNGATALMLAVGSESADLTLVEELVRRGVDPNAENRFGESAMNWAIRRGNMAAVERLKAAGASDAPAIRKAVENAVALLANSGPQFVKVSGCSSCHHQSLPQMAYAAARSRGYHVDAGVSAQQVKAVTAMFRPIREHMEKGTLTLPNPGISVTYSLLGLAAEGYAPDDTTRAMMTAVVRTQQPDGSFAALGGRPPMEFSAFTATALSIRAMRLFGNGSDGAEQIARARQWLAGARPATQEERSMKLLGLAWSNAGSDLIERAATDLLAQQRPDGGWAQLAGLESDAYATGQAVVALREAGITTGAIAHGVTYLLRTQMADGSWHVRTRSNPVQPYKESGFPHGKDQWISAAGTSWAAMALAMSQPEAMLPPTSGSL